MSEVGAFFQRIALSALAVDGLDGAENEIPPDPEVQRALSAAKIEFCQAGVLSAIMTAKPDGETRDAAMIRWFGDYLSRQFKGWKVEIAVHTHPRIISIAANAYLGSRRVYGASKETIEYVLGGFDDAPSGGGFAVAPPEPEPTPAAVKAQPAKAKNPAGKGGASAERKR